MSKASPQSLALAEKREPTQRESHELIHRLVDENRGNLDLMGSVE